MLYIQWSDDDADVDTDNNSGINDADNDNADDDVENTFAPPFLNLPSLKITARSYSCTT